MRKYLYLTWWVSHRWYKILLFSYAVNKTQQRYYLIKSLISSFWKQWIFGVRTFPTSPYIYLAAGIYSHPCPGKYVDPFAPFYSLAGLGSWSLQQSILPRLDREHRNNGLRHADREIEEMKQMTSFHGRLKPPLVFRDSTVLSLNAV